MFSSLNSHMFRAPGAMGVYAPILVIIPVLGSLVRVVPHLSKYSAIFCEFQHHISCTRDKQDDSLLHGLHNCEITIRLLGYVSVMNLGFSKG